MKNTKINYKWTNGTDYNAEIENIVVESGYTFADYLNDRQIPFDEENGEFFVLDEDCETRTGEKFWVVSEETTEEMLRG